jgi:hypothetical protein
LQSSSLAWSVGYQGKEKTQSTIPPVVMTIWRMQPQVCVLGTFGAAYASRRAARSDLLEFEFSQTTGIRCA